MSSNYQNPGYGGAGAKEPVEPTRNMSGPPVYYPSSQIFPKTEEDAQMLSSSPDKKLTKQQKKDNKAKDKQKAKSGDDKGSGAVPVPVCLPVCCAAPCTIM